MKKVNLLIVIGIVSLILYNVQKGYSQAAGLIYEPAGAGAVVLDPNSDGYSSTDNSGFISDDVAESEISFVVLPVIGSGEVDSDVRAGMDCDLTDLVNGSSGDAVYIYSDATNLFFRFRTGSTANSSKSFSILVDADESFGFTGNNADPNAVQGNPGFEIEIVLRTNFGVGLYDVDGTTAGTEQGNAVIDRPFSDYSQQSIALTNICADSDYYYDFYIPWTDITTNFPGVDATTKLRLTAQTTYNSSPAIGNPQLSDIAGVDDSSDIIDDLWEGLIDISPPTSGNDILGGSQLLPRAECPTITGPIAVGGTSVSGTSSEADGTVIEVFVDGISVGTTTVSSNNWTKTGLAALSQGEVITATAAIAGVKSTSLANCDSEIVGSICSDAPTGVTITGVNQGISGNSAETDGSTVRVYEYNYTTETWDEYMSTTVSSGSWSVDCGSASCLPTTGFYATVQASDECESGASSIVCTAVVSSEAPFITTDDIYTTTTSVTGTLTFLPTTTASVQLFVDGKYSGFSTTTNDALWTISGISGLEDGQVMTIISTEDGECPTVSLNSKTVGIRSVAPVIIGEYCVAPTGAVNTVNGITSEDPSTVTIRVYKSLTLLGTKVEETSYTVTVNSNGSWTATGVNINPEEFIWATAGSPGEGESDFSDGLQVLNKTLDPFNDLEITTVPITEGDASISGNAYINGFANIIRLYIDDAEIDGAQTTSNITLGIWTISGLNTPFDKLYAGGNAYVTMENPDILFCESDPSPIVVIQCKPPAAQTVNPVTSTTACAGETLSFELTSSEGLVTYQLIDQTGTATGSAVVGDGTSITLTTGVLSTSQTEISVKASREDVVCELIFGNTAITVNPNPTITFGPALEVCRGEILVDMNYSATTNSPDEYSIDFDAAAEADGFTDVSNLSLPTSPISIDVPVAVAAGTYNATLTVSNSTTGCESTDQAITIEVIEHVIGLGTTSDPTSCSSSDASIQLTGLDVLVTYTVNYKRNTVSASGDILTDGSGNLLISGLEDGNFTDISVTESGCTSNTIAGPVTLSDPAGPTATFDSSSDPTACGLSDGTMTLSGLSATTTYDVTFDLDGSPGSSTGISTDGSGVLVVAGLTGGSYENIAVIDALDCSSNIISGPEVLTTPAVPGMPTVNALITNDNTPVITGTWDNTNALELSVTINFATYELGTDAELTVDGSGNWTLDLSGISPVLGEGTFEVDVSNSSGTCVTPNASSDEVTIDTTPPASPSVTAQGTNDSTPIITGTWDEAGASNLSVEIGGVVYVLGTDPEISTDGSGNWTLDLSALSPALTDGIYDVILTTSDDAGNVSTDSTINEIEINSSFPNSPTIVAQKTNDTTPVITGTWDNINAVSLSVTVDGVTYQLGTDPELTVDGFGNWALDLSSISPLTDGSYNIMVSNTNGSGNTSTDGTTNEIVIDTVPPAAATINPIESNDSSPLISGTWDEASGDELTVEIDGVIYTLGVDPELTTDGAGNWTLDLSAISPPLDDGVYDVVVTATDEAGNVSTDSTTDEIIIDTAPPTASSINAVVTNDTTPVVSGTWDESNAEDLTVEIDGQVYTLGTDPELTTDGSGNWLLDLSALSPPLTDGIYDIIVTATDAAGNSSTDTTIDEIIIDTVPPGSPTVTPISTNDRTPNAVTGTWDEANGSSLTVELNGIIYALGADPELTSDGSGNWTLDLSALSPPLADGTYDLIVTTTDAAGNTSTDTTVNEITISSSADTDAEYSIEPAQNVDSYINGEMLATASDADGAIVSAVVSSGSLPPGISLDPETGELFVSDSTLLESGSYDFEITITDELGGVTVVSMSLEFLADQESQYTVNIISTIYIDGTQLATVSDADGNIISAMLAQGSFLPPGFALDPVAGEITVADASILEPEIYTFSVVTKDETGGTSSQSITITIVFSADLALTMTVSEGPYQEGHEITYQLTVTNAGPYPATNVLVINQLSNAHLFVSHNGDAGAYDSNTGHWTAGGLDVDASATLSITAELTDFGDIDNMATASADEPDDNTNNNTAVTVISVAEEDFGAAQAFSPNGDGNNDIWIIGRIEDYPNNSVKVFNRWGNRIFETTGYNNTNNAWIGQSDGKLLLGADEVPDGTYFYLIDLGNGSDPLSGYVVVKR